MFLKEGNTFFFVAGNCAKNLFETEMAKLNCSKVDAH